MNYLLKMNVWAMALSLTVGAVSADVTADLSISCGPGLGSNADNCKVESSTFPGVQNKNAPLFQPTVYPHFDLKPGDSFTRILRVDNNRDEDCFFELAGGKIKKDTEVLPEKFFSDELKVTISDGTTTIGPISFYDLFNTEVLPLYMTTLSADGVAGDAKDLSWLVTFDKNAGNEYQNAELVFDFDWNFQCGEEPAPTVLFIEKTNDKIGIVQEPGAQVKYTITVNTEETPVFNVIVLDLPPGGFSYRGGTWTAVSNLRGNLKGTITTEPTYASPGKWELGDMAANEVVTLTYITDIANDQQPGEYPDIAWTEGTQTDDPESTRVLGNEGTGFFVGTAAAIALNDPPNAKVETKTKKTIIEEEGEVLGASILPATGADNFWAFIVLGILFVGIIMIILGVYLKKKITKDVVLPAIFLMTALVMQHPIFAQNLLIRMQQPESPNRIKDLRINFVVMDIEGRNVKVRCYKQGPSDGGFSQFGADINTIPGGDDDYCYADSGVMADDGTYKFYATAQAGGDPISVSPTISIYHDSDRPGKPKNLSVDEKDSCEYDISFKTAADGGDTTRVEVYRSKDKDFTANDSTKVKDINVGSDQEAEVTINRPDCNDDYYFAVIAFDDAGNRSDVLVQTVKKTETITVDKGDVSGDSTTQKESVFGKILEAIPTEGGNISEQAGSDAVKESAVSEEPEVKGAQDSETPEESSISSRIPKQGWLAIMAFILVTGTFWYVRRKRKQN